MFFSRPIQGTTLMQIQSLNFHDVEKLTVMKGQERERLLLLIWSYHYDDPKSNFFVAVLIGKFPEIGSAFYILVSYENTASFFFFWRILHIGKFAEIGSVFYLLVSEENTASFFWRVLHMRSNTSAIL